MVDMNIVQKLEQDGMEYKNAFKVANLMETESISMEEAKKRVTKELIDENKEKATASSTIEVGTADTGAGKKSKIK
jgi:hypothetical protein